MGLRPSSLSARFAVLRTIDELANCSDGDVDSLLSSSDEIYLPAGAIVTEVGRYCTDFVVVMQGTLRATSDAGRSQLGPGDSLGWDSMWDRTINRATVVAESDVRLLVVGHAQFRAFKAVSRPPLDSWSGPIGLPEWEQAAAS